MSRRIRTIKPDVITDDPRAQNLSDAAWRLWVTLRTLADDFGNFRAEARYLAAHVWQDTARTRKVPGYLAELADPGLISLYDVGPMHYGRIDGWDTEQRIDHRSEKTRLPCPEKNEVQVIRDVSGILGVSVGTPRDTSGTNSDPLGKVGVTRARAQPPAQSGGRIGEDPEGDLGREGIGGEPSPPLDPGPTIRQIAIAYAKGLEKAFGAPMSVRSDAEATKVLAQVLPAHGPKDATTAELLAWIEDRAEAYGRAADQWERQRGCPVETFRRWLDGKSAGAAARPGVQQSTPGAARIWKPAVPLTAERKT